MVFAPTQVENKFYGSLEKLKTLNLDELAGVRTMRHGVKAMRVDYAANGELGRIVEFQDDNHVLVQFKRGKNTHHLYPYGSLEIFMRNLDAPFIPGTQGMRPMDLVNAYLMFKGDTGNLATFHKEYLALFGTPFGYRG